LVFADPQAKRKKTKEMFLAYAPKKNKTIFVVM